jgi:hypothetical protein
MPRNKKSPTTVMVEATNRLAGLKSVEENLDFGNGLTNTAFNILINDTYDTLEQYNTLLSQVDQKSNDFDVLEKKLKDMHERMLLGVAVKYGKDSDEYEMAGGTRKSERKKPIKRTNNSN